MAKKNNDEKQMFIAEYSHDLLFVREYFYNRKDDDRFDEDDRDEEYLDDGTYVYWKGWTQIFQTEKTVPIFKVYYDNKLIDSDVLIDGSYPDLKEGDKINFYGTYAKMDKLGKKQKNQGVGNYDYKRVYLVPDYIIDESDYWEYKDEDVKCILTNIPTQNIKKTDFY